MFVVIYKWRVKEGKEQEFVDGWHRLTESIYRRLGSLGSRLHKATDGSWIAYAQWPDRRTWENASEEIDDEAVRTMRGAIERRYPYTCMEVVDDLLEK
ncbi:MAG: hypothetical protein QOJ70_1891 [Acidobacteriota bacterium]|jgi:heme-degrading monooxygenase HmoA|nr:hypothetical protein [Acidobacteriota bacterium]MDT7808078.1 hypothetical protein [Acidobacteriota bacterium]